MNVIYKYFKEINKLNETLRSGWKIMNIPIDRIESVSEHTFTMALLSLAVIDKYNLCLNTDKVLKMILIHELGEIDVGDITPYETEKLLTKHANELAGITRVANIINEEWIINLWKEFEDRKSEEARFVYKMGKLQAVLQAKYYSELTNNLKIFEEFYKNASDKCEEFFEISE